MRDTSESLMAPIREADRVRLFLDYDGTLADFAPTPEHVHPDPEVIELVSRLAEHPRIRPAVISGRRLEHIEKLVPVPEVMLAGTYGVELKLPSGERTSRVRYQDIRPILETIKPRWDGLLTDRDGFFLEDKGWALAVHARHAGDTDAEAVLKHARQVAQTALEDAPSGVFRLLGGHKFLEVGPSLAHKGKTVAFLLDHYSWSGAMPLYVGDDDKDEEAFEVIHAHGGLAARVCGEPCRTVADIRLESPQETRDWLVKVSGALPRTL